MNVLVNSIIALLLLLLFNTGAHAQISVTGSVGIDHVKLNNDNQQIRYLADYTLKKEFLEDSPWVKVNASYKINPKYKLTVVGKIHGVDGRDLNRLDLSWMQDEQSDKSVGYRVGILPYRVNWCRDYETANPWVRELDPFCSFSGLNETSSASTGIQRWSSFIYQDYLIDTLVGVYNPTIDKMDTRLAFYTPVGETTKHYKAGASINAINLKTSTQLRLSVMKNWQNQRDDTGSKSGYERRLIYNTFFAGIETPLSEDVDLKITATGYPGKQTNPAYPYEYTPVSKTMELAWKPINNHRLGIGVNRYTNKTVYLNKPNEKQRLDVTTSSITYRYDIPNKNAYIVTQYLRTHDHYIFKGKLDKDARGSAFLIKLGANF